MHLSHLGYLAKDPSQVYSILLDLKCRRLKGLSCYDPPIFELVAQSRNIVKTSNITDLLHSLL